MHDQSGLPTPLATGSVLLRFSAIGAIVVCAAAAFAYTGGWFSPGRLTEDRLVQGLEQASGVHPGFRRNHAKGLCATGMFASNGNADRLSKAALFAPGQVPVVGRIAFAGGMPFVADDPATVRSLALRFLPPHAQEWRTGMINIPIFPFNTPQGFYDQGQSMLPDPATGKPDPAKIQAFAASHPDTITALGLIKKRDITSGFADTTYNAIHTFYFVDAAGVSTQVRWSAVPLQPAGPATSGSPTDKNVMFDTLIAQVAQHPVQWKLMVTVGKPGDPIRPDLPWPADRQQVDAGTITLDHVSSEDDGPCTDVNYDPTVLPSGIERSDDPILGARSGAYFRSFTLREGERGSKPPSAVTAQDVAAHSQPGTTP